MTKIKKLKDLSGNIILPITSSEVTYRPDNTTVEESLIALENNGGGSSSWGSLTGSIQDQEDLTTELNNKQDKLVSGTNIKTINNTSILGSGNISTPNTTYSEITDAEINDGTSSTSRAISGRRSQEIVNKARNGLVEGNANANNIVSNIFIGTQAEYDSLPNKTGILAIIEE